MDAAHDRGMVVVLDHTGNNWFHGPEVTGQVEDSLPCRTDPPYSLGGWRSGEDTRVATINGLEDGCWPRKVPPKQPDRSSRV